MIIPHYEYHTHQVGQYYYAYTLKKDLAFEFDKLTRPSKAGKESFTENILRQDETPKTPFRQDFFFFLYIIFYKYFII